MAISLRGNASATGLDGADITVTLPGGIAQDDVVYGAYCMDGVSNQNMAMITAGYTELADLFAADSFAANLGVFRKRQGATPDSTAVFDGIIAEEASAAVEVLIGVDTTTAEDATTTTATGSDGPTPDPPSITTVTNNAWVIAIGGSTEADVPTAPTNYINLIEDQLSPSNIMMATREIASFGAENPGTFGGIAGNVQDSWCAATVAVRPATGGAAGDGLEWASLPPRPPRLPAFIAAY